ncbi:MAG: sulfurtransferase TusA family protein [Candidatus Heimdallarchaeota archaeon]|nr:sulfurtransferase TusA family protein [Candidatus Heimdallarchaeota archaeon]MCK5185428.1 sulfurtransferase TusA family protein [Candidatus Heimdallarchaeota archaeon]
MSTDSSEVIGIILDMTDKECPKVLFELNVSIKKIKVGEILKLITNRPKSLKNIPKWCLSNNQELFLMDTSNGKYLFYIKRTQ